MLESLKGDKSVIYLRYEQNANKLYHENKFYGKNFYVSAIKHNHCEKCENAY